LPDWSPDGRFIVFATSDHKLKKIDITAGSAQALTHLPDPGRYARSTWNRQGTIIFSNRILYRISASGGAAEAITTLDKSLEETFHDVPWFLPDGRHFLYMAESTKRENNAIYLGSLDSKSRVRLMPATSQIFYSPPGFLLYVRDGRIMAQPFDADRLQLQGEPVSLAEDALDPLPAFYASSEGTLVYQRDVGHPKRPVWQWQWMDRAGKTIGRVGVPSSANSFRLSPNGERIAFSEQEYFGEPQPDIWIYDLDRDVRTRLTTDSAIDHFPIWSPDGSEVIFDSGRAPYNAHALYRKPSSGAVAEHPLFEPDPKVGYGVADWSMDGRLIVFRQMNPKNNLRDLWVLPLYGDRKPFLYLSPSFDIGNATLSPNARWLAYVSNEAGTNQVIVQPFPDASRGKWQVSGDGGEYPRWRRDGRELYYLDAKRRIVSVSVTTDGDFQLGKSIPLFDTPIPVKLNWDQGPAYPYDVTPDGQRFLISAPVDEASSATASPTFTVILNWPAALKRN
jgi:eukaryotic-like serine/threonine-protein kinase